MYELRKKCYHYHHLFPREMLTDKLPIPVVVIQILFNSHLSLVYSTGARSPACLRTPVIDSMKAQMKKKERMKFAKFGKQF